MKYNFRKTRRFKNKLIRIYYTSYSKDLEYKKDVTGIIEKRKRNGMTFLYMNEEPIVFIEYGHISNIIVLTKGLKK